MHIKKIVSGIVLMLLGVLVSNGCSGAAGSSDANHEVATLAMIESLSDSEINNAKSKLVIAYGHTSHGSQIVTGMSGLSEFMNERGRTTDLFSGLVLRDTPFSGASDLGNPNMTAWAQATRDYLDDNTEVNVVVWSWCGQVSSASEDDINTYLSLMSGLESDYPEVVFVYMTGHLDGTGLEGNLNQRNEQIRAYCRDNNKVLFDFADIESYDPDGLINYMELLCTDNCDYDSDGDGSRDTNWAITWQNAHPDEWYNCSSVHSQPLNANMKAYAFWYLMVQIARGM